MDTQNDAYETFTFVVTGRGFQLAFVDHDPTCSPSLPKNSQQELAPEKRETCEETIRNPFLLGYESGLFPGVFALCSVYGNKKISMYHKKRNFQVPDGSSHKIPSL